MLRNRAEAGSLLAEKIKRHLGDSPVIVLGLPRGGVPVAAKIAKALSAPLSVVLTKKIGAPENVEYALGSVAETGEVVLDESVVRALGVSWDYLNEASREQKDKLERYKNEFRGGAGLGALGLAGKVVVLADDGAATGFTMLAAIKAVRNFKPLKVVVAVAVSAPETLERLKASADEVVSLLTPAHFAAVGQFFQQFEQVGTKEVRAILDEFKQG